MSTTESRDFYIPKICSEHQLLKKQYMEYNSAIRKFTCDIGAGFLACHYKMASWKEGHQVNHYNEPKLY